MNKLDRPKISVFIATSIDGHIAKQNGDISWLVNFTPPTAAGEDKDCGYSKFAATVDALIMGKNTYEVVAGFDKWPYQGKRVVVLSSTLTSVCEGAELFTGDIIDLVSRLHKDGIKHIYVDGGSTVSQFIDRDLIDQLIISLIPVVLGSGIPLFSKIKNEKWCRLVSSTPYSNGIVQLQYEIAK